MNLWRWLRRRKRLTLAELVKDGPIAVKILDRGDYVEYGVFAEPGAILVTPWLGEIVSASPQLGQHVLANGDLCFEIAKRLDRERKANIETRKRLAALDAADGN
jgi:hypothetical protein